MNTSNTSDFEEETRELLILQLQSYCREVNNEVNVINQEIQLLQYRMTLPVQSDKALLDSSSSTHPQDSKYLDSRLSMNAGLGLTLTKFSKVGDQLVSRYLVLLLVLLL